MSPMLSVLEFIKSEGWFKSNPMILETIRLTTEHVEKESISNATVIEDSRRILIKIPFYKGNELQHFTSYLDGTLLHEQRENLSIYRRLNADLKTRVYYLYAEDTNSLLILLPYPDGHDRIDLVFGHLLWKAVSEHSTADLILAAKVSPLARKCGLESYASFIKSTWNARGMSLDMLTDLNESKFNRVASDNIPKSTVYSKDLIVWALNTIKDDFSNAGDYVGSTSEKDYALVQNLQEDCGLPHVLCEGFNKLCAKLSDLADSANFILLGKSITLDVTYNGVDYSKLVDKISNLLKPFESFEFKITMTPYIETVNVKGHAWCLINPSMPDILVQLRQMPAASNSNRGTDEFFDWFWKNAPDASRNAVRELMEKLEGNTYRKLS